MVVRSHPFRLRSTIARVPSRPVRKRTRKPTTPPRERILKAALASFSRHGVGATSVQDVADHAGISKQALLHHFHSKDALRDGVYGLLSQHLRDALPSVATELVSQSRDRYRGLVELMLARFDENAEACRFLAYELLEQPEVVLRWLHTETAPWRGLVRGVVEQSASPQPGFDADGHVAVLAAIMLSQSALMPRADKRWRNRVNRAALRVMLLGSHLPP